MRKIPVEQLRRDALEAGINYWDERNEETRLAFRSAMGHLITRDTKFATEVRERRAMKPHVSNKSSAVHEQLRGEITDRRRVGE